MANVPDPTRGKADDSSRNRPQDGDIFSWGSGEGGKLGHGDELDAVVPTLLVLPLVTPLSPPRMQSPLGVDGAKTPSLEDTQKHRWDLTTVPYKYASIYRCVSSETGGV